MAAPTKDTNRPGRPSSGRWGFGVGQLPTTLAGAERALSVIVAGIRIGTIIQMAPSFPRGIRISPNPGWYVVIWLLAAGTAIIVSAIVLRRRRLLGQLGVGIDVAIACVVLVTGLATVSEDQRLGSWVGYALAYALSVSLCGSAVQGALYWLSCLGAIVICALIYMGDTFTPDRIGSIIGHVLTFIVLGFVARVGVTYIRRTAQAADEARAQVAELARREESRRAQLAIHNGAALMRMLADPDLDDRTRESLQEHARLESIRMRSYLRGDRQEIKDDSAGRVSLAASIAATCDQFQDLPIDQVLDLGMHVRVRPAEATALGRALTSLLLNVRTHARAEHVVLHLDGDERLDRWTLTLHDDGAGFDPQQVTLGVGLRELVYRELERYGIEFVLDSIPGQGTTATISGGSEALNTSRSQHSKEKDSR